MKQWTRFCLLGVALVLVAGVSIRLKRMIAEDVAPTAQLPGATPIAAPPPHRLERQPTLLQAKPAEPEGPGEIPASPRYQAVPAAPADNLVKAAGPDGREAAPSANPRLQTPGSSVASNSPPGRSGEPSRPSQSPVFRSQPPVGSQASSNAPEAVPPTEQARRVYVTKANDSFWSVAQQVYGQAGYYQALYYYNRESVAQPDRIPAGTVIDVPPVEQLRREYPQLCPER